jgi:hypothetical protein
MGDELAKVAIPALLGLLGTLFGLWVGQSRWSSELRMKKRRAFDAKRHVAYEELWNIVENGHITLRVDVPEVAEVRKLEQHINAFRMRNAIYLDAEDSTLAGAYFNTVVKLATAIAESGSRTLSQQYNSTGMIVSSDVAHVQGLAAMNEQVSAAREQLIARTKALLLDTSYAVSKE